MTRRSRWVIEKQSFFEARCAAAQIVRDEAVGARDAARRHPKLAGTYLNPRAAELASAPVFSRPAQHGARRCFDGDNDENSDWVGAKDFPSPERRKGIASRRQRQSAGVVMGKKSSANLRKRRLLRCIQEQDIEMFVFCKEIRKYRADRPY